MNLYALLISLITTLAVFIGLLTQDIYVTFATYGILSILAISISNQHKLKENE